MKTVFVTLLFVFSSQVVAQVSGKSKPGKLFFKKSVIQEISNPVINVIDPKLTDNQTIVSKQNITIRGNIDDEYGIKNVTVNNELISLISSSEFYYSISLKNGSNTIQIEAVNNKDGKSIKDFTIVYNAPKELLANIVLLEPLLSNKNEYTTEETEISIIGRIDHFTNVKNLALNNISLMISNSGEFQYRLLLKDGSNLVNIKAVTAENEVIEINFKVIKMPSSSIPIITIIEPLLPSTNQINHNESIITIRGKIEDKFAIRSIEINGQAAALLGKNEFFSNISLNDGTNNIVVKSTNVKGNSAEKSFRIVTPVDDVGPEITLLEPSVSRGLKIVRKKDVLNVRGRVSDRSGVINVSVNDREVTLLQNNEFNAKLFLGLGDNQIIVKATDRKYNVSKDTFYVTRELEQVIKTGKYIALIIGINSYQGYWHPLTNAVSDARGLAETLRRDYYFDEITTLLDKEATRKNIIQKFEWIINNSSSDDNILIFYAGHGQFKRSSE